MRTEACATNKRRLLSTAWGLCSAATWVATLTAITACRPDGPEFGSGAIEQLREAAREFSLSQGLVDRLEVLLDTSASMRGFALAANANEADAGTPWQSVLGGVESLREAFATALPASGGGTPRAASTTPGWETSFYRFGGSLERLQQPLSLVSTGLGRQPLSPIGGASLGSQWLSRPCSASAGPGTSLRRAIDSLFSERITCLSLAFDQMTNDPSGRTLHVLITDAEQAVPEGNAACPTAQNLTPIQERLYDWVHNQRRFAAVVIFRLPYQRWQSQASTGNFCTCDIRNLYTYLLAPSAEVAERAFVHLAERWHGAAGSIAYLPLSARPASQFNLKMILPEDKGKLVAKVPKEAAEKHLREPEVGALPTFAIVMARDQVTVQFEVSQVAFEGTKLKTAVGSRHLDWTKASFEWREEPLRLAPKDVQPQPPGPSAATSTTADNAVRLLRIAGGRGDLDFIRLPETPLAEKHAYHRDARFLATPTQLGPNQTLPALQPAVFEIRKRDNRRRGSEVYLFELQAFSASLLDQVLGAPSLRGNEDSPCTNVDSVRLQVRHVFQRTPVVRFLLRVDY